MKKKIIGIILISIIVIIMTLGFVGSIETFCKIYFSSGTILCNDEDKKFICSKTNIEEDFYIVFYTEGIHGFEKTAKIILKGNNIFPSIYGKEIIIEQNQKKDDGEICKYIRENTNQNYALFICLLPYIFIEIICIIINNKILIPMIVTEK